VNGEEYNMANETIPTRFDKPKRSCVRGANTAKPGALAGLIFCDVSVLKLLQRMRIRIATANRMRVD
jgi:hypothetical protein